MTIYAVNQEKAKQVKATPLDSVRDLLSDLLKRGLVDAVLVAAPSRYSFLPMPTLFTDGQKLADANPLAPVAPFNMARQAVSVLKQATGKTIAVVLRPCESRALIELVKLNQATLDNAVLIGFDCAGRMENDDYLKLIETNPEAAHQPFSETVRSDKLTTTCRTCTQHVPHHSDIIICLHGLPEGATVFQAASAKGEGLFEQLDLKAVKPPAERETTVSQITAERKTAKERLFKDIHSCISPMEAFQKTIANCLNCYNCRTACPVCYCKECVFLTDVFLHKPEVLLTRAQKKGVLKIPADTTMFHLTRLAHMAHACVGCGQCSSVCPSHIPIADIFRTVAEEVQKAYDYQPGNDLDQQIPYLVYKEGGKA